MDLYAVLHKDWRPEDVSYTFDSDCRTHWLWLQLIKVADALKTIHNPPNQPWTPQGQTEKVVGFHFDLKPANIMVRFDGVLLITDFGQSMIKSVKEGNTVYGDYVGGDPVRITCSHILGFLIDFVSLS